MRKPALRLRLHPARRITAMLVVAMLVSLVLLMLPLAQERWTTRKPAWQTLTMDICSSSSARHPVLMEQKPEPVAPATPGPLPAPRGPQTSR